jgi:hypothetical protein
VSAINSPAVGESTFRSWVDAPAAPFVASPNVVVRGWCYHRGGRPIRAVRARIASATFPGLHGDPRPDVSAAFGGEPTSETSGFEIAARFPTGSSRCVLEAQREDGAWEPFQSFELTVTGDSVLSGRLGWWRFWAGALAGRSQVWQRLTPGDRDFLVAWVRHRGWLNLALQPQHAPQPIGALRFPSIRSGGRALPRFTIVTPSFNQAAFLESTMMSVLGQEGVEIDYIVQDGGSTDGSVEIIKRHAARLRHWESARDAGQADAVRRGFAHARGESDDVMMYLNSDDMLAPGALRYVAQFFAAHPEVDLMYGHRVLVDEQNQEVGRWYTPRRQWDDLQLHDLVPQETLFWRKRIWDRVGGIDPAFQFALDWDLLLRFAAAGAKFARVPVFLGMFRLHGQQKSQAQLEQTGIPEMDRLRRRTLGRAPTEEEMHSSMRRAQFDSALLCALSAYGVRV